MKSNVKPIVKPEVVCEEANMFQGLAIKPLTQRLVTHLLLDQPLEPALIVDFGVESADHYRSLKAAIFNDANDGGGDGDESNVTDEQRQLARLQDRIVELDAAYGNAAKLNTLIQRHAPAYAKIVYFNPTDWDYLEGRA